VLEPPAAPPSPAAICNTSPTVKEYEAVSEPEVVGLDPAALAEELFQLFVLLLYVITV
jgi:hypothetical protein